MPQYRALRDFGSHLGNHRQGDVFPLPDGPLPRGFDGLVERVAEPQTKDVTPASARADAVPPEAGPSKESAPLKEAGEVSPDPAPAADPPEPDEPPSPPAEQVRAGFYDDKALRPKADRGRRR